MWVYHSPIGDLVIQRTPEGKYGLLYKGVIWEACNTPEEEAGNVYMHHTGCNVWDAAYGKAKNVPHDLSEWIRI